MGQTHLAIDLLDKHLSNGALCSVTLGRNDNDEYALTMEPPEGLPCSQRQILDLLPTGSFWSQLLGWHSFVGIPFPEDSPQWMAFGVETVAKHDSRGAYVIFKAHLFPFPLTDEVLGSLQALAKEIYPAATPIYSLGDIKWAESHSVEDHSKITSQIILSAVKHFQQERNCPMLFRSVVLLENQLFPKNRNHIMATVPAIMRGFSTPKKALNCFGKTPWVGGVFRWAGRKL